MITKTQFQSLIKDKLLWPGWNWNLKDTVDGIQNTVNEEIESLVEILIDNLYTTHQNTEAWVDIFNIDKTDRDREVVNIPCQNNNLSEGDVIRIAGTLNYNNEYKILTANQTSFSINEIFKPEAFRPKYTCPTCGYYVVTEGVSTTPIFCPICDSRYPNRTNLTEYDPPRFYKLSFDKYEEDPAIYLDSHMTVSKSELSFAPKFLPDVGYKIGYNYNSELSLSENRKFIKSAIEVYRIKGTILSIKRMMRLLGYECRVNEPYKQIFTLNKSKLGGLHKLTDWEYYHHGVFEIETDNVSMAAYKKTIASTVQPVGTRMIGRNNVTLPLIPMISPTELVEYLYKAIYIESIVKYIKSGDIYDVGSSRRSRSGDREVNGFYIGKGIEMFAQAFRRVFDSNIFSLADLTTSYITTTPAGRYSTGRGPYSGSIKKVNWNTTNYNELSPLDVQLPFAVKDYQARLPGRSDHAVRSGKYAMSGTLGSGWNKSRFWIQNYGPIVRLLEPDANFADLGVERALYTAMHVKTSPGDILSVNRVLSNLRKIHGFELITQMLYKGITDWDNKRYYMYDDEARYINVYDLSQNFIQEGFDKERYLSPVLSLKPTKFVHNNYRRSGRRVVYGTDRQLGIEFKGINSVTVPIDVDEAKSFYTEVNKYKTLRANLLDETYHSDKRVIEIYHSPLLVNLKSKKSNISNIMSSRRGPMSGLSTKVPFNFKLQEISSNKKMSGGLSQNLSSSGFDIIIEGR